MSDYDGYRNKFAKHRNDKKIRGASMKKAHSNKYSFMDYNEEYPSNINDIPQSILDEQKKSKEIMDKKKSEIQQNLEDEQKQNNTINNDNNKNESLEDEYEEYSPDYFEPQVYIKK